MPANQSASAALVMDRRTSHFLDVKIAAKSLGIHPNKVSQWIYATGERIALLYRDQPGMMAAQMALWAVQAEEMKQGAEQPGNRVA